MYTPLDKENCFWLLFMFMDVELSEFDARILESALIKGA